MRHYAKTGQAVCVVNKRYIRHSAIRCDNTQNVVKLIRNQQFIGSSPIVGSNSLKTRRHKNPELRIRAIFLGFERSFFTAAREIPHRENPIQRWQGAASGLTVSCLDIS